METSGKNTNINSVVRHKSEKMQSYPGEVKDNVKKGQERVFFSRVKKEEKPIAFYPRDINM
jgi:hypothetical protein